MKVDIIIRIAFISVALGVMPPLTHAQTANIWHGNEAKADWNDSYKWELKHSPLKEETVQFRSENSVVVINKAIERDAGMQLYGKELTLKGNGNINFGSPIPHQRTVFIPASSTGSANLTIGDNLSLNGRIALAVKSFGTSTSKGTVTLKNQTTIEGKLSIGNYGIGSGKVFILDDSVYRVTDLDITTRSDKGGAAEIHVLGGTLTIDTADNPFEVFLEDPSRKIILGKYGTLRINSYDPPEQKQKLINEMIEKKRLIVSSDHRFSTPIILSKLISIQALHKDDPEAIKATMLADAKPSSPQQSSEQEAAASAPAEETIAATTHQDDAIPSNGAGFRLSGFIVFSCIFLLAIRRTDNTPPPAQTAEIEDEVDSKCIDFTQAVKQLKNKNEKEKGNAA